MRAILRKELADYFNSIRVPVLFLLVLLASGAGLFAAHQGIREALLQTGVVTGREFIFLRLFTSSGENIPPLIFFMGTTPPEPPPFYFSDNASVMYFYSDSCHWCNEEKPVLNALGGEGYRVKPMNTGRHREYWDPYGLSGTPTFIAADGTRLVGFQETEELRAFLDEHNSTV